MDRYAMAAACTGQLTLGAAIAHKDICLQVAMQAGLEARGRHLGVLYDKLCRCAFAIMIMSAGEIPCSYVHIR